MSKGTHYIDLTRNYLSALVKEIFKGIGQIMLQENALTGLLFTVGIFVGSVNMGLAALLGTAVATVFARLLGYERLAIEKGLFGFNAALVGVGVLLLLQPVLLTWLLVVIGAMASTLLQQLFYTRKIAVFTLPFVLVTWLIFLAAKWLMPELLVISAPDFSIFEGSNLFFSIRGFGQVIFQGHIISGILFFVAVFIHSPLAGLYGLAGATLSGLVALGVGMPIDAIGMGLFSYNAVLTAIVFAGPQLRDGVWGMLAVLLSLGIGMLMFTHNLLQLTFPFVAAAFLTLLIRDKVWVRISKDR